VADDVAKDREPGKCTARSTSGARNRGRQRELVLHSSPMASLIGEEGPGKAGCRRCSCSSSSSILCSRMPSVLVRGSHSPPQCPRLRPSSTKADVGSKSRQWLTWALLGLAKGSCCRAVCWQWNPRPHIQPDFPDLMKQQSNRMVCYSTMSHSWRNPT
jgi:hypothetical protein